MKPGQAINCRWTTPYREQLMARLKSLKDGSAPDPVDIQLLAFCIEVCSSQIRIDSLCRPQFSCFLGKRESSMHPPSTLAESTAYMLFMRGSPMPSCSPSKSTKSLNAKLASQTTVLGKNRRQLCPYRIGSTCLQPDFFDGYQLPRYHKTMIDADALVEQEFAVPSNCPMDESPVDAGGAGIRTGGS